MELLTKYAFGKEVWTLHNGRAAKFIIQSVHIYAKDGALTYKYASAYENGVIITADEKDCFESKEQLINYIADGD